MYDFLIDYVDMTEKIVLGLVSRIFYQKRKKEGTIFHKVTMVLLTSIST